MPQTRDNGPLPEESSFVAAARGDLPPPRVTTAMSRGRATSATRGRGRTNTGRGRTNASQVQGEAGRQASTGRGRGQAKKRSVEASSSQPENNSTRARHEGTYSYRTGPGSAYHLLFGPDQQQQQQENPQRQVPDLNEAAPEEIHTTQDAPPPF